MNPVQGIVKSLPKEVTLLDGRKATKKYDPEVEGEVYFDEAGQHVPSWDIQEALETDPVKRARNERLRFEASLDLPRQDLGGE